MSDPQKGLRGLGKIGRIFVPDSFLRREEKKIKEQRRIVSRESARQKPGYVIRDGGRKAHKNKLAAKRHAARKIAKQSRKRNRGT
jgi:hypothetical protein